MYGCLLGYPDEDCTDTLWILYSGEFLREKLSQIGDFRGENFCGLLAFATPKNAMPQISRRKLLQLATKLRNLQKVFPWKFPAIRYLDRRTSRFHYTTLEATAELAAPVWMYVHKLQEFCIPYILLATTQLKSA